MEYFNVLVMTGPALLTKDTVVRWLYACKATSPVVMLHHKCRAAQHVTYSEDVSKTVTLLQLLQGFHTTYEAASLIMMLPHQFLHGFILVRLPHHL